MKRILIIDDDTLFRQMLRQTLEREGYEVVEASDGDEGIKLYRQVPADLIIMDIIMPGREGISTIIEIRNDFPDTKIIAISGGGSIDPRIYLEVAERYGTSRTFSKPFEPKELLDAIRELLGEVIVP